MVVKNGIFINKEIFFNEYWIFDDLRYDASKYGSLRLACVQENLQSMLRSQNRTV